MYFHSDLHLAYNLLICRIICSHIVYEIYHSIYSAALLGLWQAKALNILWLVDKQNVGILFSWSEFGGSDLCDGEKLDA